MSETHEQQKRVFTVFFIKIRLDGLDLCEVLSLSPLVRLGVGSITCQLSITNNQ